MNNHLITCALPYANGNLHIGHFFEATLADIKARHFKSINKPYIFVSGDDCHGAATTLYCHQNNLDIQKHLDSQYLAHKKSYEYLKIEFDSFSKTNNPLHSQVVNWCIENILDYEKKNNVKIFNTEEVLSWYDISTKQFLPDRYVKGNCPHCEAASQHAEVCESCNKPILSHELVNPASVLSNEVVELKKTKHLTLNTQGFYEELESKKDLLHASIKNKILDNSLQQQKHIDISRDSPYYGIAVDKKYFPDLDNQFFYVWFDAPIGYLSFAFAYWAEQNQHELSKDKFNHFLDDLSLEHFIGKDIAYFHTFLWINLLKVINEKSKIKQINFHGWLTLNQVKFSKSKGHQFDLSKFSSEQIDAIRLYFFSKHDGSIQDTDFLENELCEIYNQTIVNGLANFYARSIKIAHNHNVKIKFSSKHNDNYGNLLEQTNYKKLYELIQSELKELNSAFQTAQLWKELDKNTVEIRLQNFLEKWYELYTLLALICPGIKALESKIIANEFIHISQRLEPFKLYE